MIDATPTIETALHEALLPGFRQVVAQVATGERIAASIGGAGPPVLLLHGHPQTRLTWHKVAPRLAAAGFTIVLSDLRGYGDSSRPAGGVRHANYAKRAMAADQVALMAALGHPRFALVGHDRGGRVAHRLALDHAAAVERIAVLDIAPTATMYAATDQAFATRYFWWFFLIQPFDLPERMIGADPVYFLNRHLDGQARIAGSIDPRVRADYLRCYLRPGTIHAICEDYRAAASIDLDHDAADCDQRITAPLLALWGARGVVGETYDVIATWREKASGRVTGAALDCGHTLQEEAPGALFQALLPFLRGTDTRGT